MAVYKDFIPLVEALFTFIIIVTASNQIAKLFQKLKLPLITGFIIIGTIAGPDVLKMIPRVSLDKLYFIDDIALAFIAFAAGNEMFLKELQGKLKNIGLMTAAQFFITFIVSFILIYWLSDKIPFMAGQPKEYKIGLGLLISTIFIARSPASAIAIINELKAKGPFTKTALGVTIIKDILVILLFTVTFSISANLINQIGFDFKEILKVIIELLVSIVLGYLYAKLLILIFSLRINQTIESIIFLLIGWSIFGLSHGVEHWVMHHYHFRFHIEALLTGIVASFYLTNNSKYRLHLQKIIELLSPYVYVAFFTKVGADIKLNVLAQYWKIAVILFFVRLIAIIIASIAGSIAIRDKLKTTLLSWTPYITQAGVSLGLITIISNYFPQFGQEFETILVAVIIINQFVGPPLMKWAIISAGEARIKNQKDNIGIKNVVIFGLENFSVNLAHTLLEQNWNVKVFCNKHKINQELKDDFEKKALEIKCFEQIDEQLVTSPDIENAESIILLLDDTQNYQLAQLINSFYSKKNLIVRISDFSSYQKFKQLGALVVEPSTAMVKLLLHFVISPHATSLLLGLEKNKETLDIEVLNPELHGKPLRDIRLPLGVLILSITRNGQTIVTHGYTRLRLHDVVTVLGNPDQLEQVRLKFQI